MAKEKENAPLSADSRAKSLEITISQIEKEFGKGSIMRLGDTGSCGDEATI